MIALFRKKYFMYKRNYKSMILEILLPVILVLIGFGFSFAISFPDSPLRIMQISYFPLK